MACFPTWVAFLTSCWALMVFWELFARRKAFWLLVFASLSKHRSFAMGSTIYVVFFLVLQGKFKGRFHESDLLLLLLWLSWSGCLTAALTDGLATVKHWEPDRAYVSEILCAWSMSSHDSLGGVRALVPFIIPRRSDLVLVRLELQQVVAFCCNCSESCDTVQWVLMWAFDYGMKCARAQIVDCFLTRLCWSFFTVIVCSLGGAELCSYSVSSNTSAQYGNFQLFYYLLHYWGTQSSSRLVHQIGMSVLAHLIW